MKPFTTDCLVWIALMTALVAGQEPDYLATFDMAGVSGTVIFSQLSGRSVAVCVRLARLPAGKYDWSVRQRPTAYDQRPACAEQFTGGPLADGGGDLTAAHGQLSGGANVSLDLRDDRLTLAGRRGVAGRSLLLVNAATSARVCANILDPDGAEVVTAEALFLSPFAGRVTFRQRQGSSFGATGVLVDLHSVVAPFDATAYRWGIHAFQGYDDDMDLVDRCANTKSTLFNPTSKDASSCDTADATTCPVGDLYGKLGPLTVRAVSESQTQYFVDTNLPLDGSPDSVLGLSLVLRDNAGTYVACSPVRRLAGKRVTAQISVDGISGSLVFDQRSPWDATTVAVNLTNLRGLAGGYHVHLNPIPKRIARDDKLAANDIAGGHFNPFGVVIGDSPAPGTGTVDQYEVGDISGKFGFLTGRDAYSARHVDWNMPLFGKHSVVGRSVVVHKAADGARWVYGNIGYPADVKTVQADFHSVVAGKIVLRQDAGDPYSDTSVYLDLTHADGAAGTSAHNFHVHQRPVGNDYDSESGRCSSTAGHYNPFVDVATKYNQCSFAHPLRCEVGDLSKKMEAADIAGASGSSSRKYFFTDPLLPLSGAFSVAGRSIVVHVAGRGAPRYACADLYAVPAMRLQTGVWAGGSAPSGSISISQASEYEPSTVTADLPGFAGEWYLHTLPVDPDSPAGRCTLLSVHDRYNPFQATGGGGGGGGSPGAGTHDTYEVGDLTGKFGALDGSESATYRDWNLPVYGPRSVAGRSLVVRAGSGQTACTNVDHALAAGDFSLVARASFQGQPSGVVTFRQIRFASGYSGDTTLLVTLASDEDGVEYRMHIAENCTMERPFNPYRVNTTMTACSTHRMKACCVGDLARKHGVAVGNQRALFTDTNLPLFGLRSVIGRSLAVGDGAGTRRCSRIEPDEASGRRLEHVFPSATPFDPYEFQTAVASAVAGGNGWQVVTSEEPKPLADHAGCASVGFWVIGPNVGEIVDAYNAAVIAGTLGPYDPSELCSEVAIAGSTRMGPFGVAILLLSSFLLLTV